MTLPEFLRIAYPLALPIAIQWLSSYLLLVVAARRLGAADLGAAVASVALFLIFDAGIGAARGAAAGSLDPRPADTVDQSAPEDRHRRTRSPLLAVGPATIVFLIASPILSRTFHLGFRHLALLIPSVLASELKHRIGRSPRPRSVALRAPIPAGVIRLMTGIGLVAAGLGLTGILLAVLAGEIAAALFEPLLRSSGASWKGIVVPARGPFAPSGRTAIAAAVTMALFGHGDLLLARHLLAPTAAGAYAGAAIAARSLLFIPGVAAIALWAGVISSRSDDPFRWFRQWVAAAAAGILTAGLVVVLFRGPVLRALLGAAVAVPAMSAFPFIAVGVGLLAIVWLLSYFHLVVDSKAYALIFAGVLAELLVAVSFAATEDRIAVAMVVAAGVTAVLLYQAGWAITRWSPPLSLLRPHQEILPGEALTGPANGVELSIIVPCHNAGPGLGDFLARLEGELSVVGSYEIVVVSDGSTDETLVIARELASPTLRVVHYPERSGKGHALRVGLSRARGQYVGFIDSDGDIDPQAIGPFLSLMRLYEPDIVLGSKRHPMSQVAYPGLRRVMSWVYHKLTRLLFRVNVRDTQTGLKVIRREVLAAVLPRMFEKRYAWDLELLVVARMLGFTKVFEAPVRIEYRFSSQVNPNAAFRITLDSVAIFYRRYILNSYRHTAHRLAVIRESQARV